MVFVCDTEEKKKTTKRKDTDTEIFQENGMEPVVECTISKQIEKSDAMKMKMLTYFDTMNRATFMILFEDSDC